MDQQEFRDEVLQRLTRVEEKVDLKIDEHGKAIAWLRRLVVGTLISILAAIIGSITKVAG